MTTIIKNTERDYKRYYNLSEEEKDKRRKKVREKYQNLTEEEKEERRNKNLSEEKRKS